MASYNKIILAGNLTRDPERRELQSGAVVTKFCIAINRKSKGGDETTFVDCVAWNNGNYKLADTIARYLKKGSGILVDGRLTIRSYTDKDSIQRKATEVVVDSMQMLGSGQRREEQDDRPVVTPKGGVEADESWDEIHF